MKKIFNLLSILTIGITSSICFSLSNNNSPKQVSAIGNYSTDASSYYQNITATSGQLLAAQLHDLITSTHSYYASYDDNGKNGYQKQTDRYYENGVAQEGYIYEFYSGVKWPDTWAASAGDTTGGYNREHCWCQSNSVNESGTQMWGTSGAGSDMHHIRPVEVRLNSSRNNNFYGEITNRDNYKTYAKYGTDETYALGGYVSNGTFEPLDSKKGDVARIILYLYIHYNSYNVTDLFGGYATTNGSGPSSYFTSSKLSLTKTVNKPTEDEAIDLLLKWNSDDPVDDIELRRNEQVAIYQGNRNPFIDNSDYANKIWKPSSITEPVVNSVNISQTSLTIDLANETSKQLDATIDVSNGASQSLVWTSSNEDVATVNNNGLVNAIAKGTTTIKVSSTFDNTKFATCAVTVIDSNDNSGEIPSQTGNYTWDLSIASYENNPTTELVTWTSDFATLKSIRTEGKTAVNNYLGGDTNNRTSSRFYSGNTLSIIPSANYKVQYIEFTATTTSYSETFNNSSWVNATSSANSTLVTITPIDGVSEITATIGGTCGFSKVSLYYSVINTSTPTSIVASINKTFHPGETISKEDIVVKDSFDNYIYDFEFVYDGYMFSYLDAQSGGNLTNKTFENAINYLSLTCDLSVNVSRNNYIELSNIDDALNREWTGVSGTTYTSWSDKTSSSGAVYAGNSAGPTSGDTANCIQLRSTNSNSGIVITSNSATNLINNISVIWNNATVDGRTLNIYGSNNAYTSPVDLYSSSTQGILIGTIVKGTSTSLTFPNPYQYIGIRSSSGAMYLTEIVISFGGEETPSNVANYIMFEDNEGQCVDKFNIAKQYFENMSNDNQNEFMNSEDYVIKCAKERLLSWANYLDQEIIYINGEYVFDANKVMSLTKNNISSSDELLIIAILFISLTNLIGVIYINKKRTNK